MSRRMLEVGRRRRMLLNAWLCGVFVFGHGGAPRAQQSFTRPPIATLLVPTPHPPIPRDPLRLWLAPDSSERPGTGRIPAALADLAAGVRLQVRGDFAGALPLVSSPALAQTPLTHYAAYYTGLAQLRLSRVDEARRTFQALLARSPQGYLSQAALLRQAEGAEAQGDYADAVASYEALLQRTPLDPEDALMRLAAAAAKAGDEERAAGAYARVYYEFPLSDLAEVAEGELERLPNVAPLAANSHRYTLELGRAERLFGSRRYAEARRGFEKLRPLAAGDDRDLVTLRIAECDHYLRRYRGARDALRPYLEDASRQAEAQFFFLTATRVLGEHDEYVRLARQLVGRFGDSSWAEETLNNLATHYVLLDEDARADAVFRELYEKYPAGRYAERAAWKIGWWAYKNGAYRDTIQVFEGTAAAFPRSDYRPAYLYWAGRAHDQVGERASASPRYALAATDYLNSYYGRLASDSLARRGEKLPAALDAAHASAAPVDGARPPTEDLIRLLLSLELYDEAMNELMYAQQAWGDTPAMQATIGWIYYRQGDLRRGINAMKRAYPQYLAAGGERLPADLLKVLFPLDYWDLIRRHASERNLDPYLIAALISQESTFTPDIRSSANAIGLMQIVPSTGRRYARSLRLRRYSTPMLTTPETNIRIGTAYFADLVKRFGGVHLALAGYNAGEHRVARWMAERPGLERDEFIDDIPFPETQNYVKRVLGTADDYRRLYSPGTDLLAPRPAGSETPATKKPGAAKKPAAGRQP